MSLKGTSRINFLQWGTLKVHGVHISMWLIIPRHGGESHPTVINNLSQTNNFLRTGSSLTLEIHTGDREMVSPLPCLAPSLAAVSNTHGPRIIRVEGNSYSSGLRFVSLCADLTLMRKERVSVALFKQWVRLGMYSVLSSPEFGKFLSILVQEILGIAKLELGKG